MPKSTNYSPSRHVPTKYGCGEPVDEDIQPVLCIAQPGEVGAPPGQVAFEPLHAEVLVPLLPKLDQRLVAPYTDTYAFVLRSMLT